MEGGVGAYTQELARALRALDVQISVLTCERAADPEVGAQADGVRVLPAIRTWDWVMAREVSRLATELHVDWLHVQYQTAAYAMHPAINFAPWFWRRQGHQVAWTYHDLLVPYLFPKAGNRLRTWVTERPAHFCNLVIVTNEGDRLQLAKKAAQPVTIPIGSNIQGRWLSAEARAARRMQTRLCARRSGASLFRLPQSQ